jgi:hypothetical protein
MRTNATCTDRLYQLKRAMHITTLRNFSTINCSDRVNVSRARLRAGSKKHLFDTLLATTLQQTSSMLLPIQDDAEQDSLRKKWQIQIVCSKNMESCGFFTARSYLRPRGWFICGWIIGELLTPPAIDFFSYKGEPLRDKKSSEVHNHKMTGSHLLCQFRVAERIT